MRPIGLLDIMQPLCRATRRLRLDLGDTQQEFANRLGLAISTVLRYELSRPPRGKALAQLERVAMENGLEECALSFRNALSEELGERSSAVVGDSERNRYIKIAESFLPTGHVPDGCIACSFIAHLKEHAQ